MSSRTLSNTRKVRQLCLGFASLVLVAAPIATPTATAAPAIVATKSGDPIAQAALVALASLDGQPQTAPIVTAVPDAQSAQPSSTAPTTIAVTETQTVPPSTAAVAWTDSGQGWKSAIVETDLVAQSLSAEQPTTTIPPSTIPPSTSTASKAKKSKATTTTSPATVRLLPASTVPSANGESTPVVAVADASAATAVAITPNDARRRLAELVVARAKMAPTMVDVLDAAWGAAETRRLRAVFSALAQVGTPYRYSGNEPGGFDCSGLTSFAWAAAGVRLPRISTDQINAASPRTADSLLPGDLIWRPGHIMMYVGIGQLVVDSPQTGKLAQVRDWGRVSRMGSPI